MQLWNSSERPITVAEFTFEPLTPAAFLRRSATVFPDRIAIIDGPHHWTYREFANRCDALGRGLYQLGVQSLDHVASLCANSHVQLELHHAVPACGSVLVPINYRLSVDEIVYILKHSGARILFTTAEFADLAEAVATRAQVRLVTPDAYEELLATSWTLPAPHALPEIDERQTLAINYTSGTTGKPKGVMYHHRGAYLQSLAMCHHARLGPDSRYLWTLPMFHCNGWCFTWAVTAVGGTHVCLRSIDTTEVWDKLQVDGITHLSAAPTVLTMIAESPAAIVLGDEGGVHIDTGGSPPSPSLLTKLDNLGFRVTHLYGLTETYGPLAINEWQQKWDSLSSEDQQILRARQGIGNIVAVPPRVVTPDGADVPADGRTIGEVAVRGNDVMTGYYNDDAATEAVTLGRYMLTGDLAVMHPDGYIEIRDRSKDIIISGGENIASIEIEQALDSYPDIIESAVVGTPHPRWGEVPVAYIQTRTDTPVDTEELTAYLRSRLAGFKVPKQFHFGELPKTSTGKIQKNVLRQTPSRDS